MIKDVVRKTEIVAGKDARDAYPSSMLEPPDVSSSCLEPPIQPPNSQTRFVEPGYSRIGGMPVGPFLLLRVRPGGRVSRRTRG
jgi:hypothetical protein